MTRNELGWHDKLKTVSPILLLSRSNLRYPQIFRNYLVVVFSL